MKKTCAITGHRELPVDFDKNALYDELENLVREGCDEFLCGMAEGFDLTALDCLLSLREKYPLSLHACIPFAQQDKYFSHENKKLYAKLLAACDVKTVLSESYYDGCFLARNRFMVDRCDVLFAYCTQKTGGTRYTVNYARKAGIPVLFFNS